jgi:hypothetical protein
MLKSATFSTKIPRFLGILENVCTYMRTHGHGQLWKRQTIMEKTDSYGKDGHFIIIMYFKLYIHIRIKYKNRLLSGKMAVLHWKVGTLAKQIVYK